MIFGEFSVHWQYGKTDKQKHPSRDIKKKKRMLKPNRPKIKVVHMVLDPHWCADLPAELWQSRMNNQEGSISCWRRIANRFHSYTERYSLVNRTELPVENCADPSIIDASMELQKTPPALSYGHYGVYTAHSNAILEEFGDDLDAILLIEGDTEFRVNPVEMTEKIYEAYDFALNNDGKMVTFADVRYGWTSRAAQQETAVDMGEFKKVDHFMPAYCYLIMKSERDSVINKIKTTGWHSWDIWMFWNYDCRSTLFATKEQLVFEFSGASMADYVER